MDLSSEIAKGVIANTYSEKNDKDFVWDEFIECVRILEHLDSDDVKDYLKTHCNDDIEMIKDEFKKAFKDVPEDSILRFETLRLLAIMGIIIEKEDKEDKEDDNLFTIKTEIGEELESKE